MINKYQVYDYTIRLSTIIGINYGVYTCPNKCPRENILAGIYGGAMGAFVGFASPIITGIAIVSMPGFIIKELKQ